MSHDKLLSLFTDTQDYVSGEWLSEQLGISRTAVWKQIQALKSKGYQFEAVSRLGYRLISKPAKLDVQRLQTLLQSRSFGRRVRYMAEVGSTQQAAHSWVGEGASEGCMVVAEEQTAGRGRMGRSWHSPAGKGLWVSLILQPRMDLRKAPQLTLLTAVALCRSLRKATSLEIGIKWPNDLLIDGKKISGILLESIAEDERLLYVVTGVGISVNLSVEDYPEELLGKATSLRIASGQAWDREELLAAFLGEWENLYDVYLRQGFSPIRTLWETHSVTLGRSVGMDTRSGRIEGEALGLDEQGGLRIQQLDGTVTSVFAGEIHFSEG